MDFSFSAEQHRLVKRAREFGRTYLTEDNIRLWCNDQGIPDEVSRAYLDAGLGYVASRKSWAAPLTASPSRASSSRS